MNRQSDEVQSRLQKAGEILADVFNYSEFRPGQIESLKSILSRRNVLVVMPTGSGKSVLYQIPALIDSGLTLVVSPLISLMKDQVDDLLERGVPATFVNSSLGHEVQRERLDACMHGEYKLLYIAPERFRNRNFLNMINRITISRVAVDEAHCISEWGHDFRPDYLRLKYFLQQMGYPLVTALTATATPEVQEDIIQALGLKREQVDVHVQGFDRPNLALKVVEAFNEREKVRFLMDYLMKTPGPGIVYTGTRKTTEELAEKLRAVEPATEIYHAGMDAELRTRAQEAFLSGQARIVVATSAFGMGIDKSDVRFVIHYNFPGSVEQYYQEIGRAGRDGKNSDCILLYASGDRFLRQFFIDISYPDADIVRDVYETLLEIPENPIKLTYKEIAERCAGKVKDGQVGSAVRLLDDAGVTRALSGETKITIAFSQPGSEIIPKIRGPVQRRVIESLAALIDLEEPGTYHIPVSQLCYLSGLTDDQVRRALVAMNHAGLISYSAGFKGRGIEKLQLIPIPFEEVNIDWGRHLKRRAAEEKKLAAMEAYIHSSRCRRETILRYFGECESFACGMCDRCCGIEVESRGDVVAEMPDIALPILICIRSLRFPLGKGRIAQVVTGSKDKNIIKWRLNRNPAYAAIQSNQDEVKKVIDKMIRQGFIKRKGDPARPILALTSKGRSACQERRISDISMPTAGLNETTETERKGKTNLRPAKRAGESTEEDIRMFTLQCVRALPRGLGSSKIAGILTGSKAKWVAPAGFDMMDEYGRINASQDRIREVIGTLLAEKCLVQHGSKLYPTLKLTSRGEDELRRLHAGQPAPLEMENSDDITIKEPVEPEMGDAFAPETEFFSSDPDLPIDIFGAPGSKETVDQCVWELVGKLLRSDRETARSIVKELQWYHPEKLAQVLERKFAEAVDLQAKARCVWAAGELAGHWAANFLEKCTETQQPDIRRLAVSALKKISIELHNARALHSRITTTLDRIASEAGSSSTDSQPLFDARENQEKHRML